MSKPIFIPVILSGGAGTRLWPLSTEKNPKQFLPIWNGKSLFEETLERVSDEGFMPPIVVCNKNQRKHVERASRNTGVKLSGLILEPERRDSAAAIAAVSAYVLEKFGPDAVLAILASDHRIEDVKSFHQYLKQAEQLAQEGYLVTFGIKPTRAAIEYGYIEYGLGIEKTNGFMVNCFLEKPTADKAAEYILQENFLWNSGMFIFKADAFKDEAIKHMPDIWESAVASVKNAYEDIGIFLLDHAHFSSARKTSIDYALFEHSQKVSVIPVEFSWSDVGNWQSVHEILTTPGCQNVEAGNVKTIDCNNTYIFTNNLPVRVIGLDNIAVIACEDGILITKLDQAPRVKEVI